MKVPIERFIELDHMRTSICVLLSAGYTWIYYYPNLTKDKIASLEIFALFFFLFWVALSTVDIIINFIKKRKSIIQDENYDKEILKKRKEIYDITEAFIHAILRDGTIEWQLIREFEDNLKKEILFSGKVVKYLKMLIKHANDLIMYEKAFEQLPVGDNRTKYVQRRSDQFEWIEKNEKKILKSFYRYINLGQIK